MSKKQKTEIPDDLIKNLPKELSLEVLTNSSCGTIIEYLSVNKTNLKNLDITTEQFENLTNNIDSETFNNLNVTDQLIEDDNIISLMQEEGHYYLKPWPEIENFGLDEELKQAANKFYTKCLFKYLHDNYEGDTMKKKWYDAIKKEDKLDLKNFGYFTNITIIGLSAFQDNELTSVRIPDSVTYIGYRAFENNQLTEVEIPNSVTSIGFSAFQDNELTSVTIPDSVTSIGISAFENNKLTKVRISASVTNIGSWTFQHNKLKEVKIPDSVTSIGMFAFQDNNLTIVKIPGSVQNIGFNAFDPDVRIIREGVAMTGSSGSSNSLLKLKF